MMLQKDLAEVIRILRRDERYKRLKELFSTSPMYRLHVEALTDEVMSLHQTRSIRRLNALDPKIVDSVVKAITIDQSNRSRLTEINITCVRAKTSLEDALEALKHHLLSTYQVDLRQFRTKDERSVVMDMTFRQFRKYIMKVDMLKFTTESVINDIDRASWSLKNLIEALKIHHGRENTI